MVELSAVVSRNVVNPLVVNIVEYSSVDESVGVLSCVLAFSDVPSFVLGSKVGKSSVVKLVLVSIVEDCSGVLSSVNTVDIRFVEETVVVVSRVLSIYVVLSTVLGSKVEESLVVK